ncbi:TetR/AcrR family transcriptional regulator [Frankia sp. AiPa1]|uniref:TetR/AcrR family transcriptional regulator n=1 Tax=Frankia sp. AiPa1 TaxID=573492 RepID=UPI00202AEA2B|nr:TetR family transcriptional regulator [Frankia sp. AiPa1]MCL9760414.1 TetR family transcriptional regulator [Frankia sp. AiPa1]
MRRLSLEQRRAELIDAAIRVIARDGLATASTRAITAEAGMPLGAFHYVFTSREELISAVIEQVTDEERLAAWFEANLIGEPASLTDILVAGLDAYLRLLETDPGREQALLEVAMHAVRHDQPAVRAQWATYHRAALASLDHAAELAGVRWVEPVERLARSLTASLDGLTIAWLTDRDSEAARAHIRFIARSFAALAVPVVPAAQAPQAPQAPPEHPGGHGREDTAC